MTARTHDIFAFASLVTVSAYFPPESLTVATVFTALIGNIVGSLIPDMDQSTNRLWDLLPGGDLLGKYFRKIFLGHRSLSHSILGTFLIYKLFEFILPKLLNPKFVDPHIVLVAVMIGYISHLLIDGITEEGLPLLFPLKYKFGFPPIRSWRVKTGKWFENIVVFPAIIIYIFIFIQTNQEQLIKLFDLVK